MVPSGADSVIDQLEERLHRSRAAAMDLASESEEDEDDDSVYSKHRAGTMSTFPFRAIEAVLLTVLHIMEEDMHQVKSSMVYFKC